MKTKEYYDILLEYYFDKQNNSCLSNFYSSSIGELDFACKRIMQELDCDNDKAKTIIFNTPAFANFDFAQLNKQIRTLANIFHVNNNEMKCAVLNMPTLLMHKMNTIIKITDTLISKYNFSHKNILLIASKTDIFSIDEKTLIDKIDFISKQIKDHYSTDLLDLLINTNILKTTLKDILQNLNFLQKYDNFATIFNIFAVFNCCFAENETKLALLNAVNLPKYITFSNHLTASELEKRINYLTVTNQLSYINSIILPQQEFEAMFEMFKQRNPYLTNYVSFDKYANCKYKTLKYNKKLNIYTRVDKNNYNEYFSFGKLSRITDADRFKVQLSYQSTINTKSPFYKKIKPNYKIECEIIKNPHSLEERVTNQIINKKTKGYPFVSSN